MKRIYLDHNATTPLDPRVLEAMMPHLTGTCGNASSIHQEGQAARRALEDARESLASSLNCHPMEIVFTSGGTESNNLAVIGGALANRDKGRHIVTSKIEHHCVLHACEWLAQNGFEVSYLPVNSDGSVDPDDLKNTVREDTILVSVMHVNNEVGTIQPIRELSRLAGERGILFHTDAVQSAGKIPVDVVDLGVDMLGLASHKIYGPKGVGLLYVRKEVKISPLILGGSQERGRRAGTSNVPGVVGMAEALRICLELQTRDTLRIGEVRNLLKTGIEERIGHIHIGSSLGNSISNTLHVCFPFTESEAILLNLDLKGIAVSAGSACNSGSLDTSHVLAAMGLSADYSRGGIRFSLGRGTTKEDIESTVDTLCEIIPKLRAMSPQWERYIRGEI